MLGPLKFKIVKNPIAITIAAIFIAAPFLLKDIVLMLQSTVLIRDGAPGMDSQKGVKGITQSASFDCNDGKKQVFLHLRYMQLRLLRV